MSVTIRELIDRLEELEQEHGEDCEVRLMTQLSWPFENSINGITDNFEMALSDSEDDEDSEPDETAEGIVYIVEGNQLGYGNASAWDTASI